jgi:quercetin dioxygenase-like cupin family protein
MIVLDPGAAAATAVAASPTRPATALLLDSPDARLVVFRLAPGQAVPPHRNASTVVLTVLGGEAVLSGAAGEEHVCRAGETVVYAPRETHGMRATDGELRLLAVIAPRPGERQPPESPMGGAATPAAPRPEG